MGADVRKIMIVSPSSFPGNTGDSAYYLELTLALTRRGLDCLLICPDHPQANSFDKETAGFGVKVMRIPFRPPRLATVGTTGIGLQTVANLLGFYFLEILTLLYISGRYRGKLWLIRHSLLTLPAGLVLWPLRVRILADGEMLSRSVQSRLRVSTASLRTLSAIERLVFKTYEYFRVANDIQFNMMVKAGFRPGQLVVSKVAVSVSNVPAYDPRIIPPSTFGFYGAIERWQGLDLLVRSFGRVVKVWDSARLYIIGNGSMKTILEQLVEVLGLEGNVIFVPGVPRDALFSTYFKLFRVTVAPLPELEVPVNPIKIAEALASGKPVIATDISGIRESAGDGILLVPPDDEAALAEAMISLCGESDDRVVEMSRSALESSKGFDIDSQVSVILRALLGGGEQVASVPRSPG